MYILGPTVFLLEQVAFTCQQIPQYPCLNFHRSKIPRKWLSPSLALWRLHGVTS